MTKVNLNENFEKLIQIYSRRSHMQIATAYSRHLKQEKEKNYETIHQTKSILVERQVRNF
jgi:hypothetical protein